MRDAHKGSNCFAELSLTTGFGPVDNSPSAGQIIDCTIRRRYTHPSFLSQWEAGPCNDRFWNFVI